MRGLRLIVSLSVLLALAPVAVAHGDRSVDHGTTVLEPGGSLSWTREIHWHRLMGTVDATGPVTVTIQGPQGTIPAAGPGPSLQVDHLVACCRTATWTPHTVHLTNPGDQTIEVSYDLVLLHDNLAVTAHDAEAGAWWQTLAFVSFMIAIPAWRARTPHTDDAPELWIRRSRLLHGAAWLSAGLLAAIGMVRFATWPLAGSLGATAWAPLDLGGFFNTHSLVMLWVMALWGAGVACWAGARRRGAGPTAYRVDGLLFAAGSLVVGTLMVIEFDRWLIPLVLAVVPALALLVDTLWSWAARPGETRGDPGA